MAKKFFIVLLFCLNLFSVQLAYGYDIAIIVSANLKPYHEAVTSFKQSISRQRFMNGTQMVYAFQTKDYNLADLDENDIKRLSLLIGRTDCILAVGRKAFSLAQDYSVPVIFMMVPQFENIIKNHRNITGISMMPDPEEQLAAIKSLLPGEKKIGLLYDPEKNISFISKVLSSSHSVNISAQKISSIQQVPDSIVKLKDSINALWLLPDTTVLSPVTLKLFASFSLKNRIPIIAFSSRYLNHGAAVSIYAEPAKIGEQAGNILSLLSRGTSPEQIGVQFAKKALVEINENVFRALGLPLPHIPSGTDGEHTP